MASGMQFKIRVNNIEKALKESQDAINVALEQIGVKAEGYVKELTPTDTGRLKGSITYAAPTAKSSPESPAKGSDGVSRKQKNAVIIGTNVEYAAYVELGTSRRDPVHMIKRGVGDHISEYESIIKSELSKPSI